MPTDDAPNLLTRLLLGHKSGPNGSYGIANLARGGAIIGGLGGAAAAGIAGASDGERAGESKSERMRRLLREAVTGGVLGAGTGAAFGAGAGMVPQLNKEKSLTQAGLQTVPGSLLGGAVGYTGGNTWANKRSLKAIVDNYMARLLPQVDAHAVRLGVNDAGSMIRGEVPATQTQLRSAENSVKKFMGILGRDFELSRHADFAKMRAGSPVALAGPSDIVRMMEDVARGKNLVSSASPVLPEAGAGKWLPKLIGHSNSARTYRALRPTTAGAVSGIGGMIATPLLAPYIGAILKEKLLGQ